MVAAGCAVIRYRKNGSAAGVQTGAAVTVGVERMAIGGRGMGGGAGCADVMVVVGGGGSAATWLALGLCFGGLGLRVGAGRALSLDSCNGSAVG
jgi:hypothetical protein